MTAEDVIAAGTAKSQAREGAHPARAGWLDGLPSRIVAGAVLFNFFLCFVNTRLTGISETHVILSELILVSLAAAYGFVRPDPGRYYWLIVLILQFVFLAFLSVFREEIMIRQLRDVMIMPVFAALGLAAYRADFTGTLLKLSAFIGAVALFEAFFLDVFTDFFNIREYFIAKGYDPDSFEYVDGDVFVSGIRPGERFFPFPIEIHRISSVFLEPVSLGFYAFISGLYFISMKDRLPRNQVITAIFLTLLLIWMGDARMALGSLVLVIVFRFLFSRLDHRLSALIFLASLAVSVFVVESGMFNLGGEGFGARALWMVERLVSTKDGQFFGLAPYSEEMVDSGLLYLIGTQGVFGFLLYWLPPIIFKGKFSPEARVYWFGASLFLSFGFMISYAIFTIKTAALLWFCYGYVIARTSQPDAETPETERIMT